jgi:hypothetical protein
VSGQKYADIVEKNYEVVLRSGDEWMVRCSEHEDRSASLQINVEKGLGVCFSCGLRLGPKSILGGLKEPEVDVEDILKRLDALDAAQNRDLRPVARPESLLRRYTFPNPYWASRGFTEATISAFDLGWDPIEGHAIIPLRDLRGRLLGVTRRLFDDDGPKYLYPKDFHRRLNLFASWMAAETLTDHVVITEGSVDCMMVWQAGIPAVAQYGSSISPEQVVLLRRMGITRVTLFYDNDKAGWHANHTAVGHYDPSCFYCNPKGKKGKPKYPPTSLMRDFIVSVVKYKRHSPKDPGAMSPEAITSHVDAARVYPLL